MSRDEARLDIVPPPGPSTDPVGQPGRRTRVLQVVHSLNPGGAERLVIEITRRLAPQVDLAVCCLDEKGTWAHELESQGIEVEAMGRRPGFHPALARRIRRMADRCGAGILHCHQYTPFVYGALAAMRRPRTRLIFTEHGRFLDAPSWRRRLANRVLWRRADDIWAVSAALRRDMAAEGFPDWAIRVVHNGIELGGEPTAAARQRAREQFCLAPGAVVFGTVARLVPIKDLGTLIDAFVSVRVALPEARLVIVGDGPERARLVALASRLGIDDGVRFLGLRHDARDLMAGFDVYVNCSLNEGISLTILEAMAGLLPIVATDVGGNPEIVIDGWTGVLVPPRDPAALARALRGLAASPDQRRAMGMAGRARVAREFSLERMVARYLAAYVGRE